MNICVFGDSITYGAHDSEQGGWVNRWRLFLGCKKSNIEVYNFGVSGDNTEDLLKRFEAEIKLREPDKIVFAIGINDSQFLIKEKKNRIPIDKFDNNIKELILKAKKYISDIIFIGMTSVDEVRTSPIPWNTNKIYKNSYIKEYNERIKNICEKENINFIYLFDVLNNELLEDGLHPNSKGHQKIFEVIKKEIKF